MSLSSRLYPVPVKPASGISSWSGWPDDVREVLRGWNHSTVDRPLHPRHRLSFRRSQTGSIFEPTVNTFKCTDCAHFCETNRHGAAVLDGDWLCDDCLIERARAELGVTA